MITETTKRRCVRAAQQEALFQHSKQTVFMISRTKYRVAPYSENDEHVPNVRAIAYPNGSVLYLDQHRRKPA